jgi:hypothetical protein
MKRNLLVIVLAFIGLSASAQTWQWAKGVGASASSDNSGNSITTDIHGRIYITGNIIGDTVLVGNDSVINTTNNNGFTAKYDEAGNVLWAKGSHGNSKVAGKAIASDINGNIYVTGTFESSTDTAVIFGSDTLANIGGSNSSTDIYVIKYDSTGAIQWAHRAGGMGSDVGLGIAADNSGNVYVAGYMGNGYSVGDSLNFGTSVIYYNGAGNMFLLKYNASGNPLWAKTQSGTGSAQGHGVATDSIGNVYVTGTYVNATITLDTSILPNPSTNQFIFLVKYDSAGTVLWAHGTGSTKDDNATAVVTDHSGNVYITGDIKATTLFGAYTLTNTSTNSSYMFIAKYSSNGVAEWCNSGSGGTFNFGYGLVTDPSNNVYSTGLFEGGIFFGNTINIPTGEGVFVVKYSTNGLATWAIDAVSSHAVLGNAITIDQSMNLYVTGYMQGTVSFGNDTLILSGQQDAFTAKLSNAYAGISEVQSINNNITVYPNPNDGGFNLNSQFSILNSQFIVKDVLGRTVHSENINETNSIKVSELPSGIYFWNVVSEKGIAGNGKIVVLKE